MQKFLLPYLLLLGIVIGCGGEEFSTGQGATGAAGSAGSPTAGAAGAGPGGATGAGGEGAAGQAGGVPGGSPPAGGASGSGGASAGASGASEGSGGSGAEGGTAGVGGAEGGAAGSEGGTAGAAGAAAGGTAGDAGAGQAGAAGNAGQDGGGQGGEAGTGQAGTGQAGAGQGGAGQAGSAGAGGAPECVGDLGGCFDGNQPRLCIDGKWEDAGGICNFGCSTGKCACSAPDRFSFFYDGIPLPGPTAFISDKKLGKKWWISEVATFDLAKLKCATNGLRLPTLTEAKSLVAQQPDAIQCSQTKNLDKTFVDAAEEYATVTSLDTPIWTSDLDNTGMVLIVQLTSGQVSTRDPAEKAPSTLFCIQK